MPFGCELWVYFAHTGIDLKTFTILDKFLMLYSFDKGKVQLMESIKWQMDLEDHKIDDGDIEIGDLPDCILHHILSYLPTKEVVATSVLSKRWKYLWTEVPFVDFDDSSLYSSQIDFNTHDVNCFLNFVERVILLRDKSDMKRFRLSCRICFNASHVHGWISAALKHNVQQLDLCLFVEEPFTLPSCTFDNASLTSLKLEMACTLQLPACIFFPHLRSLHLCLVTFPNDYLMQRLFSSCPSLEDLAVLDCEWVNLKSVAIAIPSLKSLMIDLPFCSVDGLQGCEIQIVAENLLFFKYSGYLSNDIYINDLSSSACALIEIPILHKKRPREIAPRTYKLFSRLKSVKGLRISSGTLESLFCTEDVLHRLPMFENLTTLELSGEFSVHCIGILMEFFQCFPKLQSLNFCQGLGLCEDYCRMKMEKSCSLSNLKTVNFQNFHGFDGEIRFLKFLLNVAYTIEKMIIVWSKSSAANHPKRQTEIINQLQSLSQASTHCALMFR